MSNPWPKVVKTATYRFKATHNLCGFTSHPDAVSTHAHEWVVTLVFSDWECQPNKGFTYDEPKIDSCWGKRVLELEGKHLNDLMPVPPTSENVACWLLCDWIPMIDENRVNYEVSAVKVRKCDRFEVEVNRSQAQRWKQHTNKKTPSNAHTE